jgi:hypothetical protein
MRKTPQTPSLANTTMLKRKQQNCNKNAYKISKSRFSTKIEHFDRHELFIPTLYVSRQFKPTWLELSDEDLIF